ncbi:amidohydrolase family protein [uncultured Enterovirga sp.]|uniref:amidohydrolase family protein n=1 Tax=uncultured Enterovirga sp. TaxID=2026352 RepID=UPI0035C96EFE
MTVALLGLKPCPPADPHPRRPTIAIPPGACDCHVHVFDGARHPYSAMRGYTPPDATLASLIHLHETLGFSRAVLTQASVHGTDNSAVLEGAASDPARLRAVVAVGPEVTDAELRRMHEAGARGIRVNLVDPGGMPFADTADIVRMAARIADFGWHVEFLVHVDGAEDFVPLCRSLPVDVVVGHLGYMPTSRSPDDPGYRAFLGLVEDGRCWVKLTGPYRISSDPSLPYADVAPFAQRLVALRPDRLLWGSDWPHVMCRGPMPNDGALVDLLAEWIPDSATRDRILVENPARLYGFPAGIGR